MEMIKMGVFISDLRKAKGFTQKDLATSLNISDKAVSKWERGLSSPDIALLTPLSEILEVTVSELLKGERDHQTEGQVEAILSANENISHEDSQNQHIKGHHINAKEISRQAVHQVVDKSKRSIHRPLTFSRKTWTFIFSCALIIALITVFIVDLALTGTFTWSLLVLGSCILSWLLVVPTLFLGTKGIKYSILSLTVFFVPYLYLMDRVINHLFLDGQPIFNIGLRITPLALVYLWIVFFLFRKGSKKLFLNLSLAALLISPLTFGIDYIMFQVLGEPLNSLNLFLDIMPPIIVAGVLFTIHKVRNVKPAEITL